MREALIVVGMWFLIAALAVVNGFLRDVVIAPALGMPLALPASGVGLSLAVILVCFFMAPWIGRKSVAYYLAVGVTWVLMTLCFEYGLGHFVMGRAWEEINVVFDVAGGNLFSLVLLVSLIAPSVVAKLRGFLA